MCSGYVAGGNTKFFGEDAAKKHGGNYTTADIRRALTKRLSFEDDASGEYDSMLAFAVPLGSGSKRDQVMSISARLLPWEITSRTPHDYFPGGAAHYSHYSKVLGLDQIHFGEDIRAAENMEFISQVCTTVSNTVPTHTTFGEWKRQLVQPTLGQLQWQWHTHTHTTS